VARARLSPARPACSPRAAFDSDLAQAEALCDLVTDPDDGITGVRLVCARPSLLAALEAAAARRSLAVIKTRPVTPVSRQLTIARQAHPARGALTKG
jgi:hypothetical protein